MYLYIKRFFDILLSLAMSVLLLPLFLLVYLAVRLTSPGHALFGQERCGRNTRLFEIYKFRTMRIDAPHDVPTGDLNDPYAYITPVGRFLRKTSLDELPQLYNILRGDMSFVGPRPGLWNQYNLIRERSRYVGRWGKTPNELRPGLTGWAQINGRDLLDDAEKARYDGEYARKISLLFDIRCFFNTVFTVFSAKGLREGTSEE